MANGREFTNELLERLNAEVRADPNLSRSELSRSVCGWLGWQGPDGEPKQVSCRVALLKLHRRGLIELPPPRGEVPYCGEMTRAGEGCKDQIACSLAELGGLRVALVTRFERELNEQWKRLMTHHYLGPGPLVGAQMRYLIGRSPIDSDSYWRFRGMRPSIQRTVTRPSGFISNVSGSSLPGSHAVRTEKGKETWFEAMGPSLRYSMTACSFLARIHSPSGPV